MRQRQTTLDRIATLAALRLLAWVGKHVDPAQQLWLDALRAELDAIDGGMARLVWAMGGLRLIWFERRRHMVNATYRYGPALLHGLEAALFVGLVWSLMQHYGSLVVILLELAGLGLVVAVPVLIALVHVIRRLALTRRATRHLDLPLESRVRPRLPLVLGILSLVALLVLWLSSPAALDQLMAKPGLPTAGVVVRSSDHSTAEGVLEQTGSLSSSEVYLTTQVKPLAVNGAPLAQLLQTKDNLQTLINKFTGIQGYGLAHGQFPSSTGIQFSAGEGGTGPDGTGHEGQYVGVRPPGRLLDAHDANSLNVLIPLDSVPKGPGWPSGGCCQGYFTYDGDTITVQSLVTGQVLGLHVVGEYIPEDGTATPLFGKILADDSVVQTLSGGYPSYAYGLHLSVNQLQTVFDRLHNRVPTAQLYDFLTDPSGSETQPGYSRFTDPYPADLLDYYYSIVDSPLPLGTIAVFWALLLAMVIVLNREARTLIHHSGLRNRRTG